MTTVLDMIADPGCFDFYSKPIYAAWVMQGYDRIIRYPHFRRYRIDRDVMNLALELYGELKPPTAEMFPCWVEGTFATKDPRLPHLSMGALIGEDRSMIGLAGDPRSGRWIDMLYDHSGTYYPGVHRTQAEVPFTDSQSKRFRRAFMGALSLIQQPRILDTTPVTYDAALQASRKKRGKPPLTDHTVVTIHVTRREKERRAEAEAHYQRTGTRLHEVSAHYKTINGNVRKIEAYWRGDASRGVIRSKDYRVKL